MDHAPPAGPPLLCLQNVTKHFGGIRALDGVNFDLWPGEIHALLGENGAGKSTLIKIVGGIHRPDQAQFFSTASRWFRERFPKLTAGVSG